MISFLNLYFRIIFEIISDTCAFYVHMGETIQHVLDKHELSINVFWYLWVVLYNARIKRYSFARKKIPLENVNYVCMKLLEYLIFIQNYFILRMNSHVQQVFIEDLLYVSVFWKQF